MKYCNKINKSYEKYIIQIAEKKYPKVRERTYSLTYYLKNFELVLSKLVQWESLKLIKGYPVNKIFHWKSIQNEFNKWSNDNIFKDAYKLFLKENYFKINKIKKSSKINLFIDASYISNKYGEEMISKSYFDKKHHYTKISILSDEHKNILSIIPVTESYYKDGNRMSFKSDISSVQETINNFLLDTKNINICGDKGYINDKKRYIHKNSKKEKIKLITCKRKNQKIKNSDEDKIILKKRYVVENSFNELKNAERIRTRKDRTINNFLSFAYLQCFINFSKKYAKKIT